jgi:hypothetical protein
MICDDKVALMMRKHKKKGNLGEEFALEKKNYFFLK